MNNKITFSEQAKRIKAKYYKNRKPGEDSMTDEAFNREMKQLMLKQEAVKPKESNDQDEDDSQFANQEYGNGGSIHIKKSHEGRFTEYKKRTGKTTEEALHSKDPHVRQMANFAKNAAKWHHADGGFLDVFDNSNGMPVYWGPNDTNGYSNFLQNSGTYNPINTDYSNFGNNAFYNPNEFSSQGFDENGLNFNDNTVVNDIVPDLKTNNSFNYSPTANVLGPAIAIGTSAIASGLLANNNKRRMDSLLSGISLGRVNPQQIDLGRERTNIRSNAALSDSGGRYIAKNATSASEAANIANSARINAQRTSGSLLGNSYQREATTNAEMRARADEENMRLGNQEQQMKMGIESQYGGQNDRIWSDFAKSTGQSIAGYMGENQQMRNDYNFLQAYQPNMDLSYDIPNNLTDWEKFKYYSGMKTPNRKITARH